MSAKWKVILLVMLIIIFISGVLLYLFVTDNRGSLASSINKDVSSIQAIIQTLGEESHRNYRKRIVSLIDYENFPEREKVVAAFAARDRQELLRLTKPFLSRLREENPNFSSFAWITNDNEVFLRVFLPMMYGDDISSMRPDIVDVNNRYAQNSGFTAAHTGLEYRIVQPVFYQGEHIGVVQFGLKDSLLPDAIHEKLDIPVALVMSNTTSPFIQKSLLPSLYGQNHTIQSRQINFFKNAREKIDWQQDRQEVTISGHRYVFARAYELLDFRQQAQGSIFVALDVTAQKKTLQTRIVFIFLLTTGLLLTSFFILYPSYGGLVDKITALNNSLERSNQKLGESVDERTVQLLESEERFETVLSSLPANVFVSAVDTNEVLFMNQHMIQEYGYDLTGQICWKVFRNDHAPCPHCTTAFLVDGNKYPDGTYTWDEKSSLTDKHYINYGRLIEWVDKRMARLHIATDITAMKSLEKKLHQKGKMEAVGMIAGGVAHNFNNSLAIIMGSLEMAQRKQSDPEMFESYIENAKVATKRSRDLISQILTYARKGDHKIIPILLGQVVEETQQLLRSTLPTTINLVYEPSLIARSLKIQADASQIQEILLNLCNNSVHAMDEVGDLIINLKSVILKHQEIPTLYDSCAGKYARITIQDSGCGIDETIREKIFDPFFTTKNASEGTGMGLATVQAIVERHAGLIKVSSIVGGGTTFELYFPLLIASKFSEIDEREQDAPRGNESVLIVDDEKVVTELEHHILSDLGYNVYSTTSSYEALKNFMSKPDYYDLVITDQTMPELTGIELVAEIKKLRPRVKTILCTGYSSKVSSEKAREEGIDAFVLKPLDLVEIAQTVRQVLDG
jgi:signal transduction histidine kinase/ActR/RegA family two-component response regulator